MALTVRAGTNDMSKAGTCNLVLLFCLSLWTEQSGCRGTGDDFRMSSIANTSQLCGRKWQSYNRGRRNVTTQWLSNQRMRSLTQHTSTWFLLLRQSQRTGSYVCRSCFMMRGENVEGLRVWNLMPCHLRPVGWGWAEGREESDGYDLESKVQVGNLGIPR